MSKIDINLLPPGAQRDRMRRLYLGRARRIMAAFFIGLGLVVAAQAVTYGSLYWIERGVTENLSGSNEDAREVLAELQRTNVRLKQVLSKADSRQLWSLRAAQVAASVPADVKILQLSVESSRPALLVKASSPARAAVVDFEKRLKGLDWVEEIDSPLQNFAVTSDGMFSFTLFSR